MSDGDVVPLGVGRKGSARREVGGRERGGEQEVRARGRGGRQRPAKIIHVMYWFIIFFFLSSIFYLLNV